MLNGISQSWPIARHCMPQKQRHQIAMIALRSAAPVSAGFGPDRVGFVPCLHRREFRQHLVHEGIDVGKASQDAGDVLAVLTAVPISCWLGDC